jgi:hypothetical protein
MVGVFFLCGGNWEVIDNSPILEIVILIFDCRKNSWKSDTSQERVKEIPLAEHDEFSGFYICSSNISFDD